VGAEVAGGRLTGLRVLESGRPRVHPATAVVLATGGFASGGLDLDSHGVLREPALHLPLQGPEPGVGQGLRPGYLEPQPLMQAGVRVDAAMRPLGPEGRPVYANLHAAGDLLAGAEPWREASGEGIAITSAHVAASAILGGS
jgi:glycerol-3-phosphate dehydrogenase subunit B